jgi:hypothetical protein
MGRVSAALKVPGDVRRRPLDQSRVQVWGRLRRFGDLARERLEFSECWLVRIRSEKR